jgi:hypothetical protein
MTIYIRWYKLGTMKVGFIYKLVSTDVNIQETYVGSTTNERRRKAQHKSSCNNASSKEYNYYVYQFIRANGGWDTFEMVRLERFEFNDLADIRARERHYVEELCATLNAKNPIQNCPHGRREDQCVVCGGVGICQHGRQRQQCKQCGGTSICPHDRLRQYCKDCNPHICEICNLTFAGKYVLDRHKRSIKHQNNLEAAVIRVMAELNLK